MIFSRKDANFLSRWWWTVDRWTLGSILAIILIGGILSFSASPAVAARLKLDTFFFVKRHLVMIPIVVGVIFFISLMQPHQIRRMCVFSYLLGLVLLILTLIYGLEIKGARRWLVFFGTSLQVSEIIKPAFAVLSAWMLSEKIKSEEFPGVMLSFVLMTLLVMLLLMQPDLGMTLVVIATWVGQLFIFGLPWIWLFLSFILGIFGFLGAYIFLPHVTKRVDQFLGGTKSVSNEMNHDLYQIKQSLEAFLQGGFFGRGPGEGIVKKHVPDAHADFVFAVAGEEFGFIVCLLIVVLFCFIVINSLSRAIKDSNLFVMLATSGLVIQFGMQALVNMGSALHLIPTKGMTLPFVSYGGSSLIALAIAIGMVLSLTRKRHIVLPHM